MRRPFMRLTLQLGAALSLLLASPHDAAACSEKVCAFQTEQTKIRPDLYQKECNTLEVARLDPTYYGPDVRAPVHFVEGVCIFERLSRGLSPFSAAVGRGMSPVESGIDALQKAQSTAMLAAQRTTAALFEGILHCRQLDAFAAGKAPSMERRCFHRSAAKASFGVVDLAGFTLSYEQGDGASRRSDDARLEQVMNEMIGCQERHLHARETASCGMLLSPSEQELARLVDQAANEVLPRYFGKDATQQGGANAPPPVTAMMARRLAEAEAASQGSEAAFEALRRKNAQLVANHDLLATKLCAGDPEGCLPAAVGAMLEAYNAAIKTAIAYAAFVAQSVEGLLLDENKQNVGKRVDENQIDAVDQAKKLTTIAAPLEALKSDLTRLSVDQQGTATMRQACALLFCEILPGGARLTRACRGVDPASATREVLSRSNPFCQSDPALQRIVGVGDGSATATSVCRAAGFEPALHDCSKRD